VVVREFDTVKKAFVEGGFTLPEAKSQVSWKDERTLYVGTDFGPGSKTKSGYPRIVKEWKRGTPLADAKTLYEASESDVSAFATRKFDHGRTWDLVGRTISVRKYEVSLLRNGKLEKIDKPDDADAEVWDDQLLVRLRSDWTVGAKTYAAGSLLASPIKAFMGGKREFQTLFTPTANSALVEFGGTKTRIFTAALTDVKSEVTAWSRDGKGTWRGAKLALDAPVQVSVSAVDADTSDEAWLTQQDFLVPTTLLVWNVASGKRESLKTTGTLFDATGLHTTQHFATSKDGTRIPYFEVGPKDAKGPQPTLISAYGGFEISRTPAYAGTVGAAWLERGGVYVLANIRGGGEYGPAWHEAAKREKRPRAFEDLAAVAEDLVARKVTTAAQLGVMGGSNGGLLTSVMLTQRPELFGAIVSAVPLTDMRRFHKLLAGASWMGEYGNPDDPKDWAFLSAYSPFHRIAPASERTYPPVLYTTSTRDDRVHPGHARKMVARLEAMGHKPFYYENIEGGHSGAADAKQAAYVSALSYAFLAKELGLSK
jgi:prolyl oligopeptidase